MAEKLLTQIGSFPQDGPAVREMCHSNLRIIGFGCRGGAQVQGGVFSGGQTRFFDRCR